MGTSFGLFVHCSITVYRQFCPLKILPYPVIHSSSLDPVNYSRVIPRALWTSMIRQPVRLTTAFLAASSMSSARKSGIPLSVRICLALSTFLPVGMKKKRDEVRYIYEPLPRVFSGLKCKVVWRNKAIMLLLCPIPA